MFIPVIVIHRGDDAEPPHFCARKISTEVEMPNVAFAYISLCASHGMAWSGSAQQLRSLRSLH